MLASVSYSSMPCGSSGSIEKSGNSAYTLGWRWRFRGLPSCLLIECCPYHWEVFPAWVSLLGEFGYNVDIACPDTPGHLETLALLGIRRLPFERLLEIP